MNAARVFPSFDDRGTLNVHAPADVAIMELREGMFEVPENYKGSVSAVTPISNRDRTSL